MKFSVAAVPVVLVIGCGNVADEPVDAPVGVTHTLSVEKTGTGDGTLTSSNVGGISCGADCSADFPEGSTVSLTTDPGAVSIFVLWSDACTGSGSCDVIMNADARVSAQFAAGLTLDFPVSGDSRSTVDNNDFNSDGDLVSGTRANTGLSQATHATVHLVLENNTLTGAACTGIQKTQEVKVSLGTVGGASSTSLGGISISAGLTVIDQEFTFAPVLGPSFRIEYITDINVSAGCGGSGYSNVGSTITLSNR